MKKPILHIHKDEEAACRAAAEEVVAIAGQSIERHGKFFLVLTGRSTPRRLYELLASPGLRDQVDWSRVEFFWGDERPVPPDHDESNYRLAHETLLGPLDIPRNHIHRLRGEEPNLDAVAEAYQNEIALALGSPPQGEPPSFDLILLGLGEDGHVASLFPATPGLLETRCWVTRNPVLKLSTERLTLTPMIINRGHNILFLVSGANKAQAVAESVAAGLISHEEAALHPERNVLSRVIGLDPDVEVDAYEPVALTPGDRLLLCTDGLTAVLDDEAIARLLAEVDDPAVACEELVRATLDGGAPDNVTVIVGVARAS